jgi:hypothetical protein
VRVLNVEIFVCHGGRGDGLGEQRQLFEGFGGAGHVDAAARAQNVGRWSLRPIGEEYDRRATGVVDGARGAVVFECGAVPTQHDCRSHRARDDFSDPVELFAYDDSAVDGR